tara:strand:+ start:1306 stop:1881 length:576 start_codon:yes stop_codon:yes gene_type:complete
MSSQLKKEFKKSDVKRMRNILTKNYTGGTKQQAGYKKSKVDYKEGDIWEESGRKWTIKDGIKQNITKFDSIKEAVKIPLACPKCKKGMSYFLSKETYKKSKMCFDCYINYISELRKNGLYEQYIRAAEKGNAKYFIQAFEDQIKEVENYIEGSYVTEAGDIEDWKGNLELHKKKITDELKEYIKFLKAKLD